jgi:adenylate cyclase
MTTQEVRRKLTAILSADVKGYSRLMGEDEESTARSLNAYKEIITGLIQVHHGRVVDAPGDNVLAEFASVVDAVRCGVEIQKELKTRNAELPENRKMEFRIGVNLGDVIEDGEQILGDGVNIAARIQGLADGGGICISGTAFDQVKHKLSVGYQYLGKQTVKNITEAVRAYKVMMEPEASGKVIGEEERKPTKWGWKVIATGALMVLVAGGLIWTFYLRGPQIERARVEKMAFPLPDKPSIAVLPFANMSGSPEQEYFCDGITDQIITSLSIIPRLFVIARNSTFVYKGKAVKVQKIAEDLGVRYVLEGSVQRSEGRIRILVQLIDATKGIHLWSERYDRDLKDLFALQDEIAKQIMTALQVKLTEGEHASGVAGSTSNLKALECFWRSEEHFFRFTKEDNAAARQWAQKAIELDPKFSAAWAQMGWTYLWDVNFGWSQSPVQSMERASECAQKAMGLSDSCAKAYSLMGYINLLNRKFDEAIENGEKAVSINPNDPIILNALAAIMHFNGKFDESIALVKKSMRLCPYYPATFLIQLSMSYFLAGRYEEALAASELMLARAHKGEFSPSMAHMSLAEAYIGLGQDQKARAHAEEMLKINPNYSLANLRKMMRYYRDPSHPERHIDALHKAGLK